MPFESSTTGVVRIGVDGTVVLANSRFLRMAERRSNELPLLWSRVATRTHPIDGPTELVLPGNRYRRVVVETVEQSPRSRLCLVLNRSVEKVAERKIRQVQRRCRHLLARLAVAEELERRRLALGLHDCVGQTLALIRFALARREKCEENPSCAEILELVDRAILETRTLTFELSSPVLHEIGLEAALRSLAERITRRDGLPVTVESDGTLKPLRLELSIVIYRTVRELLRNCVKHARAALAKIALTGTGGRVQIAVSDDGAGFEPSTVSALCFGLFSARRELADFGGRLRIDSAPGQGTQAIISVPRESGRI